MLRKNLDLSFCGEYDYPPAIREILLHVISALPVDDFVSVILGGSTARGELSFCTIGEEVHLFSDFEFFLIRRSDTPPAICQNVRMSVRPYEEQFARNALFHVDVPCPTLDEWARLPHIVRYYETRANGQVIYGEDVRKFLPEIGLKTLDYRATNEILLARLWHMVLYLPIRLADGKELGPYAKRVACFVLCRNLLDILTVLLPYEGVLLPSYRKRQRFLEENFARLGLSEIFPPGFPKLLGEALHTKLTVCGSYDIVELYESVLSAFTRALVYILKYQTGNSVLTKASVSQILAATRFAPIFGKPSARRRLYEFAIGMKRWRLSPVGIRWIHNLWKKNEMLGFLMCLNYALHSQLAGHTGERDDYLDGAYNYLGHLIPSIEVPPRMCNCNFGAQWQALRAAFAHFLSWFYRDGVTRAAYIRRAMEWIYAD